MSWMYTIGLLIVAKSIKLANFVLVKVNKQLGTKVGVLVVAFAGFWGAPSLANFKLSLSIDVHRHLSRAYASPLRYTTSRQPMKRVIT